MPMQTGSRIQRRVMVESHDAPKKSKKKKKKRSREKEGKIKTPHAYA